METPSPVPLDDGSVTLAMIQALIPLGLRVVEEALTKEVRALAGARYARRFIRASAHELRRLQERRLDDAEWLVLVLDGREAHPGLRADRE